MFSLTVTQIEDGEYQTFDPTGSLRFIGKTWEEIVFAVKDWAKTQRTEVVLVFPIGLN